MRGGKERGKEVGMTTVAVAVVEWESEGRESEGWLKVKNEKINLRLKVYVAGFSDNALFLKFFLYKIKILL